MSSRRSICVSGGARLPGVRELKFYFGQLWKQEMGMWEIYAFGESADICEKIESKKRWEKNYENVNRGYK